MLHASHQEMLPVMLSFFVVVVFFIYIVTTKSSRLLRRSHGNMKLKHCDKNSVLNVVSILSVQHTVSLNDSQSLFSYNNQII